MKKIVTSLRELDFTLQDRPALPAPTRILLTDPAYFDVEYVINPHMKGNIGEVDKSAARDQWEALRDAYLQLGLDVHVLPGVKGLPDMVFSANQSLPCLLPGVGASVGTDMGASVGADVGADSSPNTDSNSTSSPSSTSGTSTSTSTSTSIPNSTSTSTPNSTSTSIPNSTSSASTHSLHRRAVIMSLMNADQRKPEVPYFESYYRSIGYQILHLDPARTPRFEGMGDALWHPGRHLLWGAYGFRSALSAYDQISEMLDVPVLALELKDPDFYHLDTCLCLLNERTALIYPDAFTPEGLALIRHVFDVVIEAPKEDALQRFAVNAVCPDGLHVLIQRGCHQTVQSLKENGFEVMEFETSEYIKSGGSVFCMKMLYW